MSLLLQPHPTYSSPQMYLEASGVSSECWPPADKPFLPQGILLLEESLARAALQS